MSGLVDAVRTKVADTVESVEKAGRVAAGVLTLGATAMGAEVAQAFDLDSVRAGITAGMGIATEKLSETGPLKAQAISSSAIRLAESELTAEQRTQLEKEREQFNRKPGPFDITIWTPQKGELMKQVEKRAEEITSGARREAEKQVDESKLAEERSKYEEAMKAWRREMATRISLLAPERPVPGPTMLEVEQLTGKILDERAKALATQRASAIRTSSASMENSTISAAVSATAQPVRDEGFGVTSSSTTITDPGFGVTSSSSTITDPGFGGFPHRDRPVSNEAREAHNEALRRAGNTFVNVPDAAYFEELLSKRR